MKVGAKSRPPHKETPGGIPAGGPALRRFLEIEKKLEKFGRSRRIVTAKSKAGGWRSAECLTSPEG